MERDLKSMTYEELEELVSGLGRKKYLAGYIFNFVHARGVCDISEITPLSKAFRAELCELGYYISSLKVAGKTSDADGTVKYVFALADGGRVEGVVLPDDGRRTACVSTQAGCGMGCVFCATGKLGQGRDLQAGEIVEQVYRAQHDEGQRVSNVVYMGMGEPLLNYEQVVRSIRILNHPKGRRVGIRRITVSTCGIAEGIERLGREDIRARLAISLNAASDEVRTRLMPINKKYPIARILRAVKAYQMMTRQRVTFEYVLIKGINDRPADAELLAKVLGAVKCNVNLIEYNPHCGCEFEASGKAAIERFADLLRRSGYEVTVRFRLGRQINAACGQLGADWLKAP